LNANAKFFTKIAACFESADDLTCSCGVLRDDWRTPLARGIPPGTDGCMVSSGPEDCRNFSHVFDGFPPPAAVNRSAPMPTPNRSPAKTVTNQDRHTNNESDKAVQ
jgi:hypothetical protein